MQEKGSVRVRITSENVRFRKRLSNVVHSLLSSGKGWKRILDALLKLLLRGENIMIFLCLQHAL